MAVNIEQHPNGVVIWTNYNTRIDITSEYEALALMAALDDYLREIGAGEGK